MHTMTVMHQHGSIQSHFLIFFLCYWVHKNTPLPSDFSLTWMFWKLGVVNRFRNHSQPLVSNHCGILWYPLGCSELHQVISQTSWDDSHLRNLWVNDSHKGGPLFFVTICYHHFTCLFTLYLGCLEQPCICFPLGKSRAEPGRCLDRRWRAVRTSLTKDLARENDGIYSDILMIWDRIRRCDIWKALKATDPEKIDWVWSSIHRLTLDIHWISWWCGFTAPDIPRDFWDLQVLCSRNTGDETDWFDTFSLFRHMIT